MLEMNLLSSKRKIGGVGYLIEELSNAQFTTYANVSSLAGVSYGFLHNEGQGWLRFDYEGVELIVSKKSIRYNISWDQINAAGCVFGSKVITINGNQYRVRVLTGADNNPTQVNPATGYYVNGSHNSEWSRLFYPLVRDDAYIPPEIRNPNAPYTNLQLGMITENGRYSWCQETYQGNAAQRVIRGNFGVSYFYRTTSSNTGTSALYGWRPCLELVVD